jgi:hypothetical protein
MTSETHQKVAEALLAAQRKLPSVGKDATVQYGKGYDYVSAEAMIAASRAALHSAGLSLIRTGFAWVDGTEHRPPLVVCDYLLVHESGQSLSFARLPWPVIEQNGRPYDKAMAGALTTAMSYFLRDLLLVPKVDGQEEVDQRNDTAHEAGAMGVAAAVALRKRLKEAGIEQAELTAVMQSKGIQVDEDMARWPRDLQPRISAWILKRRKELAAADGCSDGPPED